jgi:hypothetical protein
MVLKMVVKRRAPLLLCLRPLQPQVVAADALGAEITRLDPLAAVPATERARLHEQGVFQRLWVDTTENKS